MAAIEISSLISINFHQTASSYSPSTAQRSIINLAALSSDTNTQTETGTKMSTAPSTTKEEVHLDEMRRSGWRGRFEGHL